ncbi:MFS general substrate transporter [Ceraceosorus guamensis]|uniref:MFS general substrate transporter n=1 Tax=Ceraceosorus guamensis TaxID=1522189 RepID=A0A316W2Q8_9BASI|nr:MFS general substrate transporter [Ceraceosorus guamensis]PWN41935.1 MFS general substrate transporter [Ceraceosorus guamensis]
MVAPIVAEIGPGVPVLPPHPGAVAPTSDSSSIASEKQDESGRKTINSDGELTLSGSETPSPSPPSGKNLAVEGLEPPRLVDLFLPQNKKRNQIKDLDTIATQRSVLDDPVKAQHFQPPTTWENYRNFDSEFRWTWREEKDLVRLLDRKVLAFACLAFVSLNLDRNNLLAANSDGMLPDLGLTQDDYGLANTLFKVCFLIAELPGQLISKRIGPDRFVPLQMGAWAILTIFQFFISGRTSYLLCRCLLGFCQGSFIPDLMLFLSLFYKNAELYMRLAIFWFGMQATSFVSSYFTYGLMQMGGVAGKEGWRWLFFWEGLLTLGMAVLAWFKMPPGPSQVKRGFYTDHDRQSKIAVMRVIRDDPGKATMHNRQGLSFKQFFETVLDYKMFPLYFHGLLFEVPQDTVQQYLTISLKQLGFSTLLSQTLSSVHYACTIFTSLAVNILVELTRTRALNCVLLGIWVLPCLIALKLLPFPNPWGFFAVATVLTSGPYIHPIQVAWVSEISGDVGKRALTASVYNMFVQGSSIIGSNTYRASDAPEYSKGNTVLIVLTTVNMLSYFFTRWFYRRINGKRDERWSSMSEEEKEHYLATTTDKGNDHLTFRFVF